MCIEVGHAIGYPRLIPGHSKRKFQEYYYACPICGLEFIKDTSSNGTYGVPETAQFHIKNVKGKEMIAINPEDPAFRPFFKQSSVKSQTRILLTPTQYREAISEKQRRDETLRKKG
jgi:hypothetical protein